MAQVRKLDFSGQKIFIGLDVHRKSYEVSIHLEETIHKTFRHSPPDVEKLSEQIKSLYPNGEYICVYEAGFCGFGLQKALTSAGISTIVVNPGDVPTTDKERQQKTDKRDSRKLARALKNGELKGIHVLTEEQQLDRALVRTRYRVAGDRRRVMHRIKSELLFWGLYPPGQQIADWVWNKSFVAWVDTQATSHSSLKVLLLELKALRVLEKDVMKQLRVLSKGQRYEKNMALLQSVPGVGFLTALLFITEIGEMTRFEKFDELCFYVGLVPQSDDSGDTHRSYRRTTRGNKRLRTALIESSWIAIRQDAELALSYNQLRKRMDAQHAIIKIARKLLNRIRRVWKRQEAYTPATS